MAESKTGNLKSFDAYRDENGQMMGQDAPTDVARPDDLGRRLSGEASGEAETARLASGRKGEGHDAATDAEAPDAGRRLGDAGQGGPASGPGAREAVDRATAPLGKSG